MQDSKLQAAIEIVVKALDVPADDIGPESSIENTPAWDSMGHMSVCLEFERRYGKALALENIVATASVRDLAAIIP